MTCPLDGAVMTGVASRIDAREVLHVFKPGRPGQARAISWFANVLVRMKDLDEDEDWDDEDEDEDDDDDDDDDEYRDRE